MSEQDQSALLPLTLSTNSKQALQEKGNDKPANDPFINGSKQWIGHSHQGFPSLCPRNAVPPTMSLMLTVVGITCSTTTTFSMMPIVMRAWRAYLIHQTHSMLTTMTVTMAMEDAVDTLNLLDTDTHDNDHEDSQSLSDDFEAPPPEPHQASQTTLSRFKDKPPHDDTKEYAPDHMRSWSWVTKQVPNINSNEGEEDKGDEEDKEDEGMKRRKGTR
ncbi:hypothetical protein M422DRAFT_240680 [Sphaerobolus stellatus SS14]|nr:hypothetical protein M422DRAFT_240680 [Sphaerobolus stellatus SS14]